MKRAVTEMKLQHGYVMKLLQVQANDWTPRNDVVLSPTNSFRRIRFGVATW